MSCAYLAPHEMSKVYFAHVSFPISNPDYACIRFMTNTFGPYVFDLVGNARLMIKALFDNFLRRQRDALQILVSHRRRGARWQMESPTYMVGTHVPRLLLRELFSWGLEVTDSSEECSCSMFGASDSRNEDEILMFGTCS